MASFLATVRPGLYYVKVHAKPGARSSAFARAAQLTDEALDIRIAAPPVEGQANEELIDFVQTTLDGLARELQAARTSGDPRRDDARAGGKRTGPGPSSSPVDDRLAAYFAGTSYKELMESKRHEQLAAVSADVKATSSPQGRSGGKKSGRKGETARGSPAVKLSGGGGAAADGREGAQLPARVTVTLLKGATSRSKTLEVSFPGSDVELISVLQLASRDAK